MFLFILSRGIGNILRRLTVGTALQAPLPIPAGTIGLSYFAKLNSTYRDFAAQQESGIGEPFHKAAMAHPRYSASITSFLCTKTAYGIYFGAEKEFDALTKATLQFPDYKPNERGLSNQEALTEAHSFREYTIRKGRRGTPHH